MIRIFQLTLYSKHTKYLKKFYNFLIKKTIKFNINLIKKVTKKQSNKRRISILKSPHVHKKAQEQFEFETHVKKINIYTSKKFKLLAFIKTLKNVLYSDIRIKIKILTNKKLKTIKLSDTKISTHNIFQKIESNKKILTKNSHIKDHEIKKLLNFLDFNSELLLYM